MRYTGRVYKIIENRNILRKAIVPGMVFREYETHDGLILAGGIELYSPRNPSAVWHKDCTISEISFEIYLNEVNKL